MKIVPDTSVIVDGRITGIVQEDEFRGSEVIVPEAVVSELEYQANRGRETGFNGLEELKNLQKLHKENIISMIFVGRRPTVDEISLSRGGEIDAMIRSTAREYDALLITSDRVQAEVGKAQGLDVFYIKPEVLEYEELEISKYFDENTMSVHLKENVVPMAKKGRPGEIQLVEIGKRPLKHSDISRMAREIVERAKSDFKSFIEIEMEGATVVQFREYRISIARPPFSEAFEITAVRPVARVSLEDYRLSDRLVERLRDTAKGVLIAGSPGAGKSTFAQAVAEFYSRDMKAVVKTMESPRDLQVGDEITQYAPIERDMQKTADILLLVRPDYTIYDELRKTRDFRIFADMRLAGVGMVGVVHATRPIDAIQRILGRVELGVIPSVVDTTIFIEDGEVKAVYDVSLTVKVPTGMQEADLARPVIEIRDLESGELMHEIYTYGEQTIVMDVSKAAPSGRKPSAHRIAEREIEREFRRRIPGARVRVELESDERARVWIDEKYIPQVIGKKGKTIEEIENSIGISIGVEPLEEREIEETLEVPVELAGNYVVLNFGKDAVGVSFDILVDDEYLFTATVGKKGTIKLRRDIELADIIMEAVKNSIPVRARVRPEA
ncbi:MULTISPECIES: PINc/VapC family ATPase [Methanothermobacter]|jgi:ATPase|uniref:PilT family ATPase n=1 Tax=Methanothermobacter defluvii TaxID=49339 RepID=A0A371NGI1_9EURY|nr:MULTISPECIES: PINc/VapC family ATPase [Methanothermobacter]MBC7110928.1 Flp pilus assembly complex ATPase component TadA [Methanothermobacter sp.]MDI6818481.1 PINc/VapC family ATPase [Methanothermobacter thermautotrophicus]MDK2874766.1 ATPase [Methanothermobacter sp.]MDN5373625.1 ATPase [Methanothermobacter sp.]NLU04266.1 Flp pilus assembly complex ATPase component TadA [Methanothermobacter sp.]